MAATNYAWKRQWADRREASTLAELDLLPESLVDRPMSRLEDYDEIPLLVLLGEPGKGKTTEIESDRVRLLALGVHVAHIDLTTVDSGSHLRALFSESLALTEWRNGQRACLFVDGLDRQLIDLAVVQSEVRNAVQSDDPAAMDRLRVRIACRTADWIDAFADALQTLWPQRLDEAGEDRPSLQVLELLGLSEADVRSAALKNNLDADQLLAEIDLRDARSIAATPITLVMLLRTVRASGILASRPELYERAVRELADEPNPLRAASDITIPPGESLAMASREAAALMLCNLPAISDDVQRDPSYAWLADLAGGYESDFYDERRHIASERSLLRGLARTGLMRVDSTGKTTFVHQTYAEYLCARWLVANRLTSTQVISLIINPHDPQRR
jgi:hypothetical protein